MSQERSRGEKAAVMLAAIAGAWVIGATMFYTSGGLNPAGLVPSAGCLIALWGALRSDVQLMWFGTGVVIVSAIAFVFSLGLVVAPAALALIAGSLLLARAPTTARN
ncbi:MAG TPA: hypothetical protein VFL72_06580 [Acidimicrobiia bacterium]|nr:hypothetical protein [Acidimicrobiia bacterium]